MKKKNSTTTNITPAEVELALKNLEIDVLHKLVDYVQAIIRWKRNPQKYLEPHSYNGKINYTPPIKGKNNDKHIS